MKAYKTAAVAKQQAAARSNKTGTAHLYFKEADDLFFVGTEADMLEYQSLNSLGQIHALTVSGELVVIAPKAEFQPVLEEAKSDARVAKDRKLRPITKEFNFAGEDDRYFYVLVGPRKFKLAKSRVTGEVVGNFITICMSEKYAATRPELEIECSVAGGEFPIADAA